MRLKGSCHCGAVRFCVESETPYPYQRCYCSICRKTAGGGPDRHFCPKCGSAPWLRDRRRAQWIYRFATAADTKLPAPKERQHIMLDSRASLVPVPRTASAACRAERRRAPVDSRPSNAPAAPRCPPGSPR